MMTAGYPEQGGGGGGPPSAGAAAVGGATAPTPQPVVPPAHAPAQPTHDQCLSGQPLPPDHHSYHDQAQFEADKRSVYKHPLFPLLALLFEKCELATQSADSVSSDSFNLDIQAFVQHQERDRKPFLMNDPEVDGLMIKAIQVLRIHLLELEKVQELCKDFCNRYITCLKGKMQSENLLRTEYGYDSPGSPDGGSPYNGHHQLHMAHPHPQVVSTSGQVLAGEYLDGQQQQQAALCLQVTQQHHNHHHHHHQQQQQAEYHQQHHHLHQIQSQELQHDQLATPSRSPLGMVATTKSTALPGPPVTTTLPTTIVHVSPTTPTTSLSTPASPTLIQGSTPLSQIGAHPCPPPPETSIVNLLAPLTPPSCEEEEDGGMRRQKRGVLPKHATAIMKAWLFQHIVHPYPSEDEKRHIAAQTNLTLLQVNNWFINARRRILQPMIDASTPPDQKTKKSKAYNPKASATRFWPDSLISLHGKPQNNNNNNNTASSLARKTNLSNTEVTASPISTTGEEDVEEIEDEEDEERRREQEEEGEEQYKDENDFLRPKSESPLHEELDVGTL
ncbi:homeobox protein PKNOX2-like isoform X1 [Homarus americanus]|uniref:homeobox protein PKNOX2-like isoform X1 n=1 Tax=Homarus americanus TaxID=6706 RepID=UPI001C478D63|nr:homeobox protein PKNOX2-like isoform X1 [Homarus americanus]